MKILMILNSTFPKPLDLRVIKQAPSLIAAGFEVTLLCLREKGEPETDIYNGINIIRIKAGTSQYQLAFWDVIMSLTFTHHIFKRAVEKIVREKKIDFIHVHDLPLAGTALAVKKKTGVKVVVDLHENYADALRVWFQWKKNPIARLKNALFLKPEKWEKYEGIAVREADAVLTVVDEMKNRIVTSHHIPSSKVRVISNTETKKFAEQAVDQNIYGDFSKNKFVVAYTGGIGPHRGVDTVIDAMVHLKHKPIVFAIIGTGSADTMTKLQAQITTNGLEKSVLLLGHKPFNTVFSYMSMADANVIPHKSNPQNENGVPHKLFQSMMAQKPVLVSSCGPLIRIVSDCKSGLIFKAEDAIDCAAKILELYENPNAGKQFGINGKEAATGKYSWEETAKTLVNVYRETK